MQVYIRAQTNGLFRPARDLKAFSKVHLKKGESKYVQFTLDKRSFSTYDIETKDWVIE
ncbi:fibronectin type III-like domain-contianing protein [Niallia taxi]|uniref:fibronectin type III-like domain-contianing protein n=1 Tax=Niallia taxi TaxID=2499688 RepID=UPI003AB642CF